MLIKDKWVNEDVTNFITSQTMGVQPNNEPGSDGQELGGGEFGGGGARGDF